MARIRRTAIAGMAAVAIIAAFATPVVIAQQSDPSGGTGPDSAQAAPDQNSERGARAEDRRWRLDRPDREERWGRRSFEDYAQDGDRRERWGRDGRDGDRGMGRFDRGERDGRGFDRDEWRGRGVDRRGFDDPRDGWRERGLGDGMMGAHGWMGHPGMMMGGPRMLRRACGPDGERIVAFMLGRLERLTRPNEQQQQVWQNLKDAAGKALDTVRAACPSEIAVTPPGRLAAAEKRLEAMLEAVRTVRPAMDAFYGSLSEEQKARLYMAQPFMGGWGERWHDRIWGDRRGDRGPERDEGWRERWRGRDDGRRGPWRDPGDDEMGRDRDRDGWPDQWRGRS